MARLFDSPVAIVLILVVILLLFGAPKLPGMARSLGQSMRILKSEVGEMKNDGKDGDTGVETYDNGNITVTPPKANGSTSANPDPNFKSS